MHVKNLLEYFAAILHVSSKNVIKSFVETFGYAPEVLCYVYNITEFWDCGCVEEFFYFFAFLKNDCLILHSLFNVSKNHFDLKVWKVAYYLAATLEEVRYIIFILSIILNFSDIFFMAAYYLYCDWIIFMYIGGCSNPNNSN